RGEAGQAGRPVPPGTARGLGRRALAAPARLAAEPGGQALVVRTIVLLQRGADGLRHRRAGTGVLRGEDGMVRGQAEEVEDLVIGRPGIGEEVIAVDDMDPVAAEDPLEVL